MTLLKPLNGTTMLTPYEQYSIQSLHREGQLIPEQYLGEKKLPFQLALEPSYTPLEETSVATSSYRKHSATLPLPGPQPTTTPGMYLLIRLIYIMDPTCLSLHFPTQ
jgi:hypothetical protein